MQLSSSPGISDVLFSSFQITKWLSKTLALAVCVPVLLIALLILGACLLVGSTESLHNAMVNLGTVPLSDWEEFIHIPLQFFYLIAGVVIVYRIVLFLRVSPHSHRLAAKVEQRFPLIVKRLNSWPSTIVFVAVMVSLTVLILQPKRNLDDRVKSVRAEGLTGDRAGLVLADGRVLSGAATIVKEGNEYRVVFADIQ